MDSRDPKWKVNASKVARTPVNGDVPFEPPPWLQHFAKVGGLLIIGPGKTHAQNTRILRSRSKLRIRNNGDFNSAIESAGHFAKKLNRTTYVYLGNSFGHVIWRVAYDPSEYLNPINNTGMSVISVSPMLDVQYHDVIR